MGKERYLVSPNLEGVPKSEPIEIFPGQPEIQKPAFKKTPLMLKVEQTIKDGLPEFLERNYSVNYLSQRDIAQVIINISEGHLQIEGAHIHYWLRVFDVPTRSMPDGVRLAWQNPGKRERMIEKIHSPISDRKRSEAMRKNWQRTHN